MAPNSQHLKKGSFKICPHIKLCWTYKTLNQPRSSLGLELASQQLFCDTENTEKSQKLSTKWKITENSFFAIQNKKDV